MIPAHIKYLIVGAGIHGLSTAYHLATALKASGRGSGEDVLVIDKGSIAAGASGIACGVIRNNYFQPAMRELMAQCVEVWESDMEAYSFHPVGYMQISPDCMGEDMAAVAAAAAPPGPSTPSLIQFVRLLLPPSFDAETAGAIVDALKATQEECGANALAPQARPSAQFIVGGKFETETLPERLAAVLARVLGQVVIELTQSWSLRAPGDRRRSCAVHATVTGMTVSVPVGFPDSEGHGAEPLLRLGAPSLRAAQRLTEPALSGSF